MPLRHLQHFLIQTTDLEGTTKWYEDVLGMKRGPHPDFKFPVEWLYLGDDDVLHLTEGGAGVSENGAFVSADAIAQSSFACPSGASLSCRIPLVTSSVSGAKSSAKFRSVACTPSQD